MVWNYKCPVCGCPVEIDWDRHKREVECPGCQTVHYPPTPSEDHFAYVSEQHWPKEMEQAVVALHGTTCAAPGCFQNYATLVFRKSLKNGGRTAVDNLVPLCAAHVREKGDREYDSWAESLKQAGPAEQPQKAAAEEATLASWAQRSAEVFSKLHQSTRSTLIASSALVGAGGPAGGLLLRAPFMRTGVSRLLLDYDWSLKSGACQLVLAAWPHDKAPDPATIGRPEFEGHATAVEHKAGAGSAKLELSLPEMPVGRWVAAAKAVGPEPLQLAEYVLVGTD